MSISTDNRLWQAIHIVGKTYSPKDNDTKDAFLCFFDCLCDLLPEKNYRNTLRSFIHQTPPNEYITSSENAFQWTYKLHLYANLVKKKRGQLPIDISLDKAISNYSNITKTDWGNAFWFIMHYIAANLPEQLNNTQRTSFIAFIMCIRFLIPCEECKYHMTEYIMKTDIYPFMTNNKTAFQYTWVFHNNVSERTKKNTMSFQDALNLYVVNNKVYSMIDY